MRITLATCTIVAGAVMLASAGPVTTGRGSVDVSTIQMGDSCIIAATPEPAQGGKKWEIAMGDCANEQALYFRYNGMRGCVCVCVC